jgi:hypothetical protein
VLGIKRSSAILRRSLILLLLLFPILQAFTQEKPSQKDLEAWHQKALEHWSLQEPDVFDMDDLIDAMEDGEDRPEQEDWLGDFFTWLFYEDTNLWAKVLVYLIATVILTLIVFLVIRGVSKKAVIEAAVEQKEEDFSHYAHNKIPPPGAEALSLGQYLENLYLYFIEYLARKKLLPESAFLTNREIRQELKDQPRERSIFIPLSRMSEEVLYGHKQADHEEVLEVYTAIKDLPS